MIFGHFCDFFAILCTFVVGGDTDCPNGAYCSHEQFPIPVTLSIRVLPMVVLTPCPSIMRFDWPSPSHNW